VTNYSFRNNAIYSSDFVNDTRFVLLEFTSVYPFFSCRSSRCNHFRIAFSRNDDGVVFENVSLTIHIRLNYYARVVDDHHKQWLRILVRYFSKNFSFDFYKLDTQRYGQTFVAKFDMENTHSDPLNGVFVDGDVGD